MQQITKEEKDFLISKGYIKRYNGKYADLIILNKHKKSNRKKYYTTEIIARNLKYMDY